MNEIVRTILIYAGVVLFGYLCGCFSLSYLLAKIRGFDIRKVGTKNAGASNAAVTMGWKIGVLVGFCDTIKCFIAVLTVSLVLKGDGYGLAPYIAGISCVVGHMHPFYLKFRGGKGFASYLGMIMAIDWKFFIILVVGIFLVALISDYIVAGTMLTMVSFPVFNLILGHSLVAAILTALLSALIIFRHRKNLSDIFHGRERKISALFKKKSS